jgi:hypothetical protein
MPAHEFTIHETPDHFWIIALDGLALTLLYESQDEAEAIAQMLREQYARYDKVSDTSEEQDTLASA